MRTRIQFQHPIWVPDLDDNDEVRGKRGKRGVDMEEALPVDYRTFGGQLNEAA